MNENIKNLAGSLFITIGLAVFLRPLQDQYGSNIYNIAVAIPFVMLTVIFTINSGGIRVRKRSRNKRKNTSNTFTEKEVKSMMARQYKELSHDKKSNRPPNNHANNVAVGSCNRAASAENSIFSGNSNNDGKRN